MNHFKNQKGNAITAALGVIIFAALIWFLVALILHPYQAIDSDRNKELKVMTESIKNSQFEKTFKAQISYNLEDGKINNKEFVGISELYNGYKTAQLTGEEKTFNEKTQSNLNKKYKGDKENIVFIKWFVSIFCFIAMIFALNVGFKSMKPPSQLERG